MFLIDKIAEQKISEAIKRGELDDLPGSGKPLCLDDDALIPEELRAGYRLLKNAGYLPADLQLRKDIKTVEALIAETQSQEQQQQLSRQMHYLLLRLGITKPDHPLLSEAFYSNKIHHHSDTRD